MAKTGKIQGASAFAKALKEYGYGKSMADGVKRIATEQRQQGFQQGITYALQSLTLFERLTGHRLER